MADATTSAALAAVRRHAEAARASLSRVPLGPAVPAEDTAARLGVAAADLEYLRSSVSPGLAYHALSPAALPPVPAHVPEFMRTRPEPAQEAADAAALAEAGRLAAVRAATAPVSSDGRAPQPSPAAAAAAATHEYNSAARALLAEYGFAARACLARVAALTAPGPVAAAAVSAPGRGD